MSHKFSEGRVILFGSYCYIYTSVDNTVLMKWGSTAGGRHKVAARAPMCVYP